MIKKILLTTLSLLFIASISFAQLEEIMGCHHRHQQIKMEPPTEEEKLAMLLSAARSDTMDILNYTINLEIMSTSARFIKGSTALTITPLMANVNQINLDLLELQVDSVLMNAMPLTYSYDGLLLYVDFPTDLEIGTTYTIEVFYEGAPMVDPSGFGGLDFQNGYAYNLGIGLTSNPPNFGRSWYPCFDSFVERATYEFNIFTRGNNKAYCVGTFIEEVPIVGDTIRRTYQMNQLIPTYLSSIAVSNYQEINDVHNGESGAIPTQLLCKPEDVADMTSTFVELGDAIDAFEFWYGPYPWERVGYVSTPRGAMEHPTNIAYPTSTAVGGNTFGHRRLMAHELAHCWWGDVVTVGSARDMWVKEGNAEYGAHLMTEYAFGHEAFIDQVKDNHLDNVLQSAHVDDDGFQPLSNIPFEHIYGTHTYRKGAAMLHNMRGYLGDSLFRVGQRAVLDQYAYQSASAQQYRDALTASTGYDMTDFFDAWILNPGYSAFEVNEKDYIAGATGFETNLTIEQKVRAAPNYHQNVPIDVTFIDAAGNQETHNVMCSGQYTDVSISGNVEPYLITINQHNRLNMAHMSDQEILEETGSNNLEYSQLAFSVDAINTPTLIHADHYWVAPDPIEFNPDNAQISSTHYWRIEGDFENGLEAKATFEYRKLLDEDLVGTTENDIILIYRRGFGYEWEEYPFYSKLALVPTDGNGFFNLTRVLPGEYTFANGTLPLYTSTKEVTGKEHNPIQLSPNPAINQVVLQKEFDHFINHLQLELIASNGQVVQQEELHVHDSFLQHQLDLSSFPVGMYWVKLTDETGFLIGVEALEIIR